MRSYTEWKTFQSYLILSLAIIEGFIYVLGNIHTTLWNHWSFSICVWGRLDQANHMISWRSRVQKAPFSVHEKTESWRFQIPCVWRAFPESSVSWRIIVDSRPDHIYWLKLRFQISQAYNLWTLPRTQISCFLCFILTLPFGLSAKANEPGVEILYCISSNSLLDKTGSGTIKRKLTLIFLF